ncbi:hypothetical protein HMPREF3113_12620 [Stenotrophomonas sp. HMSC10F06]|nr:hypothetical protein HMPREF3113_12620 [Stenotrophomonas sp. HMSC10F06]
MDDIRLNLPAEATEVMHGREVIDISGMPRHSRRGAGTDSIDGTVKVPDWKISHRNPIDIDLTYFSMGKCSDDYRMPFLAKSIHEDAERLLTTSANRRLEIGSNH